MRTPTVYLCGPITGHTLEEATAWRGIVTAALSSEAELIDPTRDQPESTRHSDSPETRIVSTARLIHGKRTVARDRADIRRCDVVFACFLEAKSVSIGAVGEIFWADAMGKSIVIVRDEGNVHNHDMLNEIASCIVTDLESGIEQVRRMLRQKAGG